MAEIEDETSSQLYKNMIKYLYNVSTELPSSLNILNSYCSSKFRILEARGNVCIPASKNKAFERCPKCCLLLREGQSHYSIAPEVKRGKFARKLMNKVANVKPLTKYQAKYLKRVKNDNQNQLVVTCKFCQNKVVYDLPKPEKPMKCGDNQSNNNLVSKKKSKKKKDKFCGLNSQAVVSAHLRKGKKTKQCAPTDCTPTYIPLVAEKEQLSTKFSRKMEQKRLDMLKNALINRTKMPMASNNPLTQFLKSFN